MATETLETQAASALNVYYTVRNKAGNYLDSDYTFKALASCTDPYWEATERIAKAGSGWSIYVADLNLSSLAPTLVTIEAVAQAWRRAGGSPDLAADTPISEGAELVAQLGKLGRRVIVPKARIASTTTAGTAVEVQAWLEADGVLVELHTVDSSATCTLAILQRGNAPLFDLDSTEMGAVTAGHFFEPTYSNPGFTADRSYRGLVAITANSLTFSSGVVTFTVVP